MRRPDLCARVLIAVAVLLSATACSAGRPGVTDAPAPYEDRVHQGRRVVAPDADLAVVWIDNGCSGVLVGRRSVLTAAHCTSGRRTQVVFAQDRAVTTFAVLGVAEVAVMPGFAGSVRDPARLGTTDTDDLQLLRLTRPVPRTVEVGGVAVELQPVRVNTTSAPVPCTACTRHVGFGRVVEGQDNYQKHSVVSGIDRVTDAKFEYGQVVDGTYRGACHGDSGGAGFTMVHGEEQLSGVINDGDDACESESWDIRMDRPDVAGFLLSTLTRWEDCEVQGCASGSR